MLSLEASSEGAWGNDLTFQIDYNTALATQFNITARNTVTGESEVLRNLVPGPTLTAALEAQSQFVRVQTGTSPPAALPPAAAPIALGATPARLGKDGTIDSGMIAPTPPNGTGIYALERADLFNLLVIPPIAQSYDTAGERVLPVAIKGLAAPSAANTGRSSSSIRTRPGRSRATSRR